MPVVLFGTFPRDRTLYVWFGDQVVSGVSSDGATLAVTTEHRMSEGIVDVAVKFTLSRLYVLTLRDAFTFTAPPTTAPATTAPAGPPASGSTPSTGTATSSPPTTQPTTTARPATTLPATTTPRVPTTTPAPASTATAASSTTIPSLVVPRGSVTVRVPATGAVGLMTLGSMEPCALAICPALRVTPDRSGGG